MLRYIAIAIIVVLFNVASVFAGEVIMAQFEREEELLLLEERFVITATKTKKKVREAPSMVTVITAQEIRNMGA